MKKVIVLLGVILFSGFFFNDSKAALADDVINQLKNDTSFKNKLIKEIKDDLIYQLNYDYMFKRNIIDAINEDSGFQKMIGNYIEGYCNVDKNRIKCTSYRQL